MDASVVLDHIDREEYPWEPQFLEVDERAHAMAYLDVGPRDAPPILFVHGNPTWSYLWRHQVKAFEQTHRCVVPDLVGFGCSDKPRDRGYHSLERHIRNLCTLVRHLDLRDVTLVVHDWGGPIGLGWATREPERLGRIVLTNTSTFQAEVGHKLPFWYRMSRSAGIGEILYLKQNVMVESIIPKLLRVRDKKDRAKITAAYRAPVPFPDDRTAMLRFTRMVPERMGDESFEEIGEIDAGLADLDVPVYAIWARKDPAFRKAIAHRFMETLPRGTPAAIHDLPGAGHFLQEDEPGALNELLASFLNGKA